MILTADQLKKIAPYASQAKINIYLPALNEYIQKYQINANIRRLAAFLAQILHESGSLNYNLELASGQAYEGRKDLGNTQPGDGVKFKGRGLIQITGRANYKQFSDFIGVDFVANPKLLENPEYSVLSAVWYWQTRNINKPADAGDFIKVTKLINGGTNGLADREKYYTKALEVLK